MENLSTNFINCLTFNEKSYEAIYSQDKLCWTYVSSSFEEYAKSYKSNSKISLKNIVVSGFRSLLSVPYHLFALTFRAPWKELMITLGRDLQRTCAYLLMPFWESRAVYILENNRFQTLVASGLKTDAIRNKILARYADRLTIPEKLTSFLEFFAKDDTGQQRFVSLLRTCVHKDKIMKLFVKTLAEKKVDYLKLMDTYLHSKNYSTNAGEGVSITDLQVMASFAEAMVEDFSKNPSFTQMVTLIKYLIGLKSNTVLSIFFIKVAKKYEGMKSEISPKCHLVFLFALAQLKTAIKSQHKNFKDQDNNRKNEYEKHTKTVKDDLKKYALNDTFGKIDQYPENIQNIVNFIRNGRELFPEHNFTDIDKKIRDLFKLEETAGNEKVKKCYKQWAILLHPDKCDNKNYHEIYLKAMMLLNKAYSAFEKKIAK